MTLLQDLLEIVTTSQKAHTAADAVAHIKKHAHLFTVEGISEVEVGDKLYVGWVLHGKLCYLLEASKSQLKVLGYKEGFYQVNLASSDRDARVQGMRIGELYKHAAKLHPLLSAAYETEAGSRAWRSFPNALVAIKLSDAVKHDAKLTQASERAVNGDLRSLSKASIDTYIASPQAELAYKIPTARLMLI